MSEKRHHKPVKKGRVRVPVIMQMEALECGAASLAMVMAYYGKWVPLERVRLDCGVSRNGSNAKNMLVAARNHGFEAQGFRCEPETLKENIELPCILHWNFNHFVVFNGYRGGYAWINDPARGEVRITEEELDRAFTGVCLQITPGPDFQPSGRRKSMLDFAKSRLKGTGPAAAFVLLSTLTGYCFGLINPAFVRFFVDRLLTGEKQELLLPFLGLMLLAGVIQTAIAWEQASRALKIQGQMTVTGSSEYMWKVLRLPMEFFSQRLSGDILERQGMNASVTATLVTTFAPLLLNILMMAVYFVIMFRCSPVLTLIGIAAMTLQLLITQFISLKRVNITRVQMRDAGKLASSTVSGIRMIETIKAGGTENGFFQKWAGYQASVNTQNVRYTVTDRLLGIIPSILSAAANALVLILGVLLTMQGKFSLGMIMLFQGYLASFMAPAMTIISAGQSLQEMRAGMERIEDVMQYPDDPGFSDEPLSEDKAYDKLFGDVELRHVTFGYSHLEEPLIRDFSMHIKPGSRVAFVGPSGCGGTVSCLGGRDPV